MEYDGRDTNEDRADQAREALDAFARTTGMDRAGEGRETIMTDMLADLRHLCDRHGIEHGRVWNGDGEGVGRTCVGPKRKGVKGMPYDEPGKNEERADWAQAALDAFARTSGTSRAGEDRETIMTALLANLRHLCDRHGIEYGKADRDAYRSYLNDLTPGEEGSAEPVRPAKPVQRRGGARRGEHYRNALT